MSDASAGRPKVLLIDDDPMIGRLAARALEQLAGATVVVAGSGAAGIAAAEKELPDLVLLDLWMEDVDGPEVLATLRARPSTASIPVAMLSGEHDPALVARCEALGAAGFVQKPFDPRELAAQVKDLLQRAKGANDG